MMSLLVGRSFSKGEEVYAKKPFGTGQKWMAAVVQEVTSPVSCLVKLQDVRLVRRHQDHLRRRIDEALVRGTHLDLQLLNKNPMYCHSDSDRSISHYAKIELTHAENSSTSASPDNPTVNEWVEASTETPVHPCRLCIGKLVLVELLSRVLLNAQECPEHTPRGIVSHLTGTRAVDLLYTSPLM